MDKKLSRISNEKPLAKRTQEIVDYAFANPHLSQGDIAIHFSLTKQRISNVMRSERVLALFPLLARRQRKSLMRKALAIEDALLSSCARCVC
jgi:hypothetical protein